MLIAKFVFQPWTSVPIAIQCKGQDFAFSCDVPSQAPFPTDLSDRDRIIAERCWQAIASTLMQVCS